MPLIAFVRTFIAGRYHSTTTHGAKRTKRTTEAKLIKRSVLFCTDLKLLCNVMNKNDSINFPIEKLCAIEASSHAKKQVRMRRLCENCNGIWRALDVARSYLARFSLSGLFGHSSGVDPHMKFHMPSVQQLFTFDRVEENILQVQMQIDIKRIDSYILSDAEQKLEGIAFFVTDRNNKIFRLYVNFICWNSFTALQWICGIFQS